MTLLNAVIASAAKQSIAPAQRWIASSLALLAMTGVCGEISQKEMI